MSKLIANKVNISADDVNGKPENQIALGGFGLFKYTFASNMSTLVKINMLILLFALPVIVFAFMYQLQVLSVGLLLPFSGNIGVGYPAVFGLESLALNSKFFINCMMYVALVPCIALLGIGLAGGFNAVRCLTYNVGTKSVVKNFFSGVKRSFTKMAIMYFIFGVSGMAVLFTYNAVDMVALDMWVKIAYILASVVQFVFVAGMTLFCSTSSAKYNFSLGKTLKNSVLFTVGVFPLTLTTLILSALPVVIMILVMNIEIINVMVITIALLMLFSFIVLAWTVYGNWVFDNFVEEKASSKPTVKNDTDKKSYKKDKIAQSTADEESADEETSEEETSEEKTDEDKKDKPVEKNSEEDKKDKTQYSNKNKSTAIKFKKK